MDVAIGLWHRLSFGDPGLEVPSCIKTKISQATQTAIPNQDVRQRWNSFTFFTRGTPAVWRARSLSVAFCRNGGVSVSQVTARGPNSV